MGLIAPVTTVGATVFHTIDVLAGITMAQVIRPGAPVLFGGAPATFHMKVASSPMSAIEALQLDAAYIAVAKSLELPCQSYMALSDGPILDAQAGAETFGSALIAALAGVNSVSGPGMLDFLLVFSLPKLVFDDEMCAPGAALRARDRAEGRPAGRAAHRPAHGRPAPDHGRAHDGALADRAVPAVRDRRSRQPRELAQGRRQGHVRSGRARRSTAGWPPIGRLRRIRPSTPSCAGSSRPASSRRPSCRSSRRRPSRQARPARRPSGRGA